MLRVFIGYDEKEPIAYHVLCHSILKRSSIPVSIIPLNRDNISHAFWRQRGEYDSTDFSNSRWIVPYLCNYEGMAIFMDCDMLMLGDIADLAAQFDPAYTVQCVKHHHVPRETEKFLGQKQTKYQRKNWSSLMLFNNDKCRMLTRHIVNTMSPGLWFHQFDWVDDEGVGPIPTEYNVLVGYDTAQETDLLPHFTLGGPWHGYNDVDYAEAWWSEYHDALQGQNPIHYRELR